MLFQRFSDLKAMSVNIHHCLRKTKNSGSLLGEGFISAVHFQLPLRQQCAVPKPAVSLFQFQNMKHMKKENHFRKELRNVQKNMYNSPVVLLLKRLERTDMSRLSWKKIASYFKAKKESCF